MSTLQGKEEDALDSLLHLEDDFYMEGYEQGFADGDRAGRLEGRIFGLEKGFEKYVAMGRLHGRAAVWAGKLSPAESSVHNPTQEEKIETSKPEDLEPTSVHDPSEKIRPIPAIERKKNMSARLEAHVRTLYALTEPESLSIENSEDSVADFDDRLKRAEGKMKVLEKLTGERLADGEQKEISQGDGSIEDISSLNARH